MWKRRDMSYRPTRLSADDKQPAARPRFNRRMLIGGYLLLCLVALAVFFVRSAARSAVEPVGRADPANAAQVEIGRGIYTTRCAACHGANLEGASAVALNATAMVRQHDDRWIFTTIKAGGQATAAPGSISAMPALGGSLSDEQIWAVIAYIKSTWQAQGRAAQPPVP
jgi:mono/diheme cytochrome c family protein